MMEWYLDQNHFWYYRPKITVLVEKNSYLHEEIVPFQKKGRVIVQGDLNAWAIVVNDKGDIPNRNWMSQPSIEEKYYLNYGK